MNYLPQIKTTMKRIEQRIKVSISFDELNQNVKTLYFPQGTSSKFIEEFIEMNYPEWYSIWD